jgi:hypothetical protein
MKKAQVTFLVTLLLLLLLLLLLPAGCLNCNGRECGACTLMISRFANDFAGGAATNNASHNFAVGAIVKSTPRWRLEKVCE